MSDLFMLLCLSLSLTYIILYMIFKRPLLALFIFPVIMALGLFAKMMPTTGPSDVIIESVWLYIHLPFTILGTALFLFATISSIMYFVQEKQLKKKNFGFIFRRFPPLDVINSLTTSTLMTGFYFFSIGVFSGIIWMGYEHGRMGIFSPKMIFAIVTWFIFGTITYFKQFRGMTPRSTAYSTVAGFVSVVVTYIGVAIFLMG
ncbi:cytochrome c biogenesis protein CcsA [Limisalsivibrio acetivorans]|uniref:cytochrome c biogenesis protein CcsA n=1 Tax=Limisalsivibrio acetivorans TaxID=1304888 RepID=UPI00040D18D0|nr:cytochrome c biogenesis protein CcsA [Limisalsivibrio acetivorans]